MRDISLQEVLNNAFNFHTSDMYTAIPAVILAVRSEAEQLIDVQPLINIANVDSTHTERPQILGVPYIFPATSTSALILPVNVGDTVLLVFSMRALESFKQGSGIPANPLNWARFNKKDAMAILGLFPQKKAVNDPKKHTNPHSTKDTVLVHNLGTADEVEVRLKSNGGVVINCKTAEVNATQSAHIETPNLTVDADNTTWNGDISLNGGLTATGDVQAGGKSLINHTHPFVAKAGTDPAVTSTPI